MGILTQSVQDRASELHFNKIQGCCPGRRTGLHGGTGDNGKPAQISVCWGDVIKAELCKDEPNSPGHKQIQSGGKE